MQTGVSPTVWADATDGPPPIQLSVVGASPLPVAEQLAGDPEFSGTIVLGFVPRILYNASGAAEDITRALVGEHQRVLRSPARRSELALAGTVAGRLVIQSPELRVTRLLAALWSGERPQPARWRGLRDRFTPMDAGRIPAGPAEYEAFVQGLSVPDESQVRAIVSRLRTAAELQSRKGGRLVVVALPTCGEVRDVEERYFPAGRFWAPLAEALPGRTVWSHDHPAMLDFTCADGSHLDQGDAPGFTRALARRLGEL